MMVLIRESLPKMSETNSGLGKLVKFAQNSYLRDPGSPKLRMVRNGYAAMRFGDEGHPDTLIH